MEFTGQHSTVVVSNMIDGDKVTVMLPESCCVSSSDMYCTRMRITSCKVALIDLLIQNSSVLGVLGVSVMFIQVIVTVVIVFSDYIANIFIVVVVIFIKISFIILSKELVGLSASRWRFFA